jgi:glutamine synthetase
MWMSRFLLERICEIFNVEVTFDPKPIPGGCVGGGAASSFVHLWCADSVCVMPGTTACG